MCVKIIGTTEDGYLLEASKGEVAHLVGFSSIYSTGLPRLGVGDEVLVHEMFQRLYDLNKNKKTLENTADKLEQIAALLREESPIIWNDGGTQCGGGEG